MANRYHVVLILLICLLFHPLTALGQPAEMVQDIYPGFVSGLFGLAPCFPTGGFSEPGYFLAVRGNKMLFTARDEAHGIELWRADSSWQLSLLADIADGPVGAFSDYCIPSESVYVEDRLFLPPWNGEVGRELWVSDGTPGGTHLVKDIRPGVLNSSPDRLTEFHDRLIFVANDGTHGRELWVSDGSSAGTQMLRDIRPGAQSSAPYPLATVGDFLFFAALSPTSTESHLWRSDGTPEGTVRVRDNNPIVNPAHLTDVNGTLFFVTQTNLPLPVELWTSDGTDAGTQVIASFTPPALIDRPSELTAVDDLLFFSADNGAGNSGLWKSDGTPEGTVLVSASPRPEELIATSDGRIFGRASSETLGRELYLSDGTAEGTGIVADINPGTTGSFPSRFAEYQGLIYFAASDGDSGQELWATDGTFSGTALVQDINPGDANSNPRRLTVFGDTLFFGADDGVHGSEMWALGERPSAIPIPALDRVGLASLVLALALSALVVLRRIAGG